VGYGALNVEDLARWRRPLRPSCNTKVFSWGLAIGVAIVLIAFSVERFIAAGTGRARDVSVAALKEKLERPDGIPPVAHSVVDSGVAPVDASNEDTQRPAAHHDLDALRMKWLAMGDEIALAWENCRELREAWREAFERSIEEITYDLISEVLGERLKYYECLTPATVALLDLIAESGDLREIFTMPFVWDNRDYLEALQYVSWLLNAQLWNGASLDDHAKAADLFSGLVRMPDVGTSHILEGVFEPYWSWSVLRGALESGVVHDGDWDELLAVLEARRRQEFYFDQVQRETEATLHIFENWTSFHSDLPFSERPVRSLRTWAYPRLTPSLFNHDVDRFSRAMNELLDLAARPYYTIKAELAQFCEDFDVEDSIYQTKLVHPV